MGKQKSTGGSKTRSKKPDTAAINPKPPRLGNVEQLKKWINERLDEEMFELHCDEHLIQLSLLDPKFATSVEQGAKRRRVVAAVRRKDHDAFARLADTEELRQLAFAKHNIGREKGEGRPGDHPQTIKWCREDALADAKRIYQILKETYPQEYRGSTPLAMEIAADRWGIKEKVLINFKKNRPRAGKASKS